MIKNEFQKIKGLLKQKFTLRGKVLMSQQIHEEAKRRKEENVNFYLDEISQIKENIEKKESFIKQFEKKFFEVEIFVQRESKMSQLERFRCFHYYEVLGFINNNEVYQYRRNLLNEEIDSIRNDIVKIIDENLAVKKNISNAGKKTKGKNTQNILSEFDLFSYRDKNKNESNDNDKLNKNNLIQEKNLNYKKIEESCIKKNLFLQRKNEHLKAKYHNLLTKINNFNNSEFGNLIINHRQTIKNLNFAEKNAALNSLINNNLGMARKNSLGINFILGAYKKPAVECKSFLDSSQIKSDFEENEEYSFIRSAKRKSTKNNKKQTNQNNKNNSNKGLNDKTERKEKSKGSKSGLYRVCNTEGDYNCNFSAKSPENEDNEPTENLKVKVSKRVLNQKSNFYKKENAKNGLNSGRSGGAKFSSDKNQINLMNLKRLQPLDSPFEITQQQEAKANNHKIAAEDNNAKIVLSKLENRNKKNSLFVNNNNNNNNNNKNDNSQSKKESGSKLQKEAIDNNKQANEKNKINISKAKDELKKLEQLEPERNKNSDFNSESGSASDDSADKVYEYENYDLEGISAFEISFNKESPVFKKKNKNDSKGKSNINSNNSPENVAVEFKSKINTKKVRSNSLCCDRNSVNFQRIFKLYNIDYADSSASNESGSEKSESQWNSESFNYSNNFYFDDFEKQDAKEEIQKKILIPTLKLSAIKSIENNNFESFNKKNTNKNKKDYCDVNEFILEKESDDEFALEGQGDLLADNEIKISGKNAATSRHYRKNTLNLSPIMKPKNSDDVWNLRSFHP